MLGCPTFCAGCSNGHSQELFVLLCAESLSASNTRYAPRAPWHVSELHYAMFLSNTRVDLLHGLVPCTFLLSACKCALTLSAGVRTNRRAYASRPRSSTRMCTAMARCACAHQKLHIICSRRSVELPTYTLSFACAASSCCACWLCWQLALLRQLAPASAFSTDACS